MSKKKWRPDPKIRRKPGPPKGTPAPPRKVNRTALYINGKKVSADEYALLKEEETEENGEE